MTEIVIDVVSATEYALDQTGDELAGVMWDWPRRIFDWQNIEGGVDHVADADGDLTDRTADRIGGHLAA